MLCVGPPNGSQQGPKAASTLINKCTKNNQKHIIPVDLSKKKLDEVLNLALKAHKLIGCRGVTRSDFKYFNGKFYLLEINTQPGMTKLSLVPEIAAHKGISFMRLLQWIINDASINR